MVHFGRCIGSGIVRYFRGTAKPTIFKHFGTGRVVFEHAGVYGVVLGHEEGDELQHQLYGCCGIAASAVRRAQPVAYLDILVAVCRRGIFCPDAANNVAIGADGVSAAWFGGGVLYKLLRMVQLIWGRYQQVACNLYRGYEVVQRGRVCGVPRLNSERMVYDIAHAARELVCRAERQLPAIILRYFAIAGKAVFFYHALAGYILTMGKGNNAAALRCQRR